ncbi:putative reverse transcriptase, fragment (plasmid) [Shigella dysenteriae Sd197]|uniref:Reverse transcriptase n=1 Tax=Shigella dysenteriae serotype 1 (strain Sd197) TaxID=300267 RepID=Q326N9_SHIDS|nr:putative reverse transcriptase, fragment [Shigella dysenteriae Sd197]
MARTRSGRETSRTITAHRLRGNTGRRVIEGDLSSYVDTVHHRLLMKALCRRISDARFMRLLWKTPC